VRRINRLLLCVPGFSAPFGAASASEYHGQITFGGCPCSRSYRYGDTGKKKFTRRRQIRRRLLLRPIYPMDRGRLRSRCNCSRARGRCRRDSEFACGQVGARVAADRPAYGAHQDHAGPADFAARCKRAAVQKKPGDAASGTTEIPKAPDEQSQQSSDGFLVNGSVNNAATSQYSLDRAFGNRRPNSKSLYNGGFAAILNKLRSRCASLFAERA